jgi:hypothetical protein
MMASDFLVWNYDLSRDLAAAICIIRKNVGSISFVLPNGGDVTRKTKRLDAACADAS